MDDKPYFLPWFLEEVMVVLANTWMGMQAGGSPGGVDTAVGVGAPLTTGGPPAPETCIVVICIFSKDSLWFSAALVLLTFFCKYQLILVILRG